MNVFFFCFFFNSFVIQRELVFFSVLQMYLFVSMDSRLFVLCNPSDIQKWVKVKMHPGIFAVMSALKHIVKC